LRRAHHPSESFRLMVGTVRFAHPTISHKVDLMSDANPSRIALLGIPLEIGASQAGTLMGPAALRTAGIGRILGQLGFTVEDHGDMTPSGLEPAERSPPANAKFYDEIKG